MEHFRISFKIYLLSGAISLLFCLAIVWGNSRAQNGLLQQRRGEIQHAVEGVWGVVERYAPLARQGALPKEEAQANALAMVKSLRFGGQNYFWINDLQPRMLMHPINSQMQGADLSQVADPNGFKLFAAMADLAKNQGGGYLQYVWDKPGSPSPVGKVSYVKLVPDWGWVLGAGLYLDDIEAQLAAVRNATLAGAGAVVLVVLVLVWAISRSISRPLNQAVGMIESLGRGAWRIDCT